MTSNQTMYDYIGWTPCLNGQLVFNLVECGLKTNRYSTIEIKHIDKNSDGDLVEYILVHSTVNWKDFGDDDLNGLWSVVLFSKRKMKDNYHNGVVCFMPDGKKYVEHSNEWNKALEIAQEVNHKLTIEEEINAVQKFVEFESAIDNISRNNEYCNKVDFKLEEDGIVWIKPLNKQPENYSAQINPPTCAHINYP